MSFQDGTADADQPVSFYVSDSSLGTLGSGTAKWTSLPAAVSQSSGWNLATGAPHPSVHSLSGAFDPPETPLAFDPLPTGSVNGVANLVDDLNPSAGTVSLLNDVDAGSTVVVSFSFDVVDSYGAGSRHAKVTSPSDIDGEWVGFSEVASTTNSSSNATSGVFRGRITPSAAQAADASGDGRVWVQTGDSLTITYFGSGGSQHTDSVPVDVPTPASTNTPTSTHAYAHSNQYTDPNEHGHPDSNGHSNADQHTHSDKYAYFECRRQHSHAAADTFEHSDAN